MKLLFERSRAGRGSDLLPACDVPVVTYDQGLLRAEAPRLPEMAEVDLSRHYTELAKQTHGVNDGFYPLGSCTMKYNPRVNEEAAAQPGFTQLHPLQPVETVQGALEVIYTAEKMLCEITGMDGMTFQPAAGATASIPACCSSASITRAGATRPGRRSLCRTLPTARTPLLPPWQASKWSPCPPTSREAWTWTPCGRRSAPIPPA